MFLMINTVTYTFNISGCIADIRSFLMINAFLIKAIESSVVEFNSGLLN